MKLLTSKEEHDKAIQSDCLVQYSTTWCAPCKALKPHMEKVAERVDFPVYLIYVDEVDLEGSKEVLTVPLVCRYVENESFEVTGRTVLAILKELEV